jgi:hypothetical protein
VKFSVFTAANIKITVFCNKEQYGLVATDRYISVANDGGSTRLSNIIQFSPDYMLLHPRRQPFSYLLL